MYFSNRIPLTPDADWAPPSQSENSRRNRHAPTLQTFDLYPHRRSTEYTHRPSPGFEYQSRRAEHPELLTNTTPAAATFAGAASAANQQAASGQNAVNDNGTVDAALANDAASNDPATNIEEQLDVDVGKSDLDASGIFDTSDVPIMPATSSDTRVARNAYFS